MAHPALSALLKTAVDAGKDIVAAIKPGQNLTQEIANFQNLVSDAVSDVSEIGDLSAELAALQPSDYESLAAEAITDAAFTSTQAQAIAAAGVKLLGDLSS